MTRNERKAMWEERVRAFQHSGQSVKQWCAENQVQVNNMYLWIKKCNKPITSVSTSSDWMMVDMKQQPKEAPSQLTLKVGCVTIEVPRNFDQELLVEVIQVLQSRC